MKRIYKIFPFHNLCSTEHFDYEASRIRGGGGDDNNEVSVLEKIPN